MRTKLTHAGAALALLLCVSAAAAAQSGRAPQAKGTAADEKQEEKAERARRAAPDDTLDTRIDTRNAQTAGGAGTAAAAGPQSDEEAAVLPVYNNFLSEYRLGPEDVISITVFGHERYSRPNVTIPPDGLLSYYLIPEGIQVSGKTTRQVAEEIARNLDEYIIDPKVTVTLEKAQSYRYAVLGDVAQPGVRLMTRRLTVYEALLESGGVLGTGNKKKVLLVRHGADRMLTQRVVDVAAIERGRARDDVYLSPGDQIFVPGNRMKTVNKILEILPVISFARIFTGGW